jgi:tetratricopeptide (TPR) repeat protein
MAAALHREKYRGVFPVVPTIFNEQGDLDLEGQRRCVDFMIDAGSQGVCILANFSEQFVLLDEERELLTREILKHVRGRVPVIVTTTPFSTKVCAERSRRAQDEGASMVMVMPPYHDATIRATPMVQRYWLPAIRAAIALQRNDPNRAVELLQVMSTMELGPQGLFTIYLRGEAYLILHDGNRAAAEFQKFIDHRGMVRDSPTGMLARLGLACAYAMQGDTMKARTAYQDFLAVWKDADPDVPVLQQAKAEYASLQ